MKTVDFGYEHVTPAEKTARVRGVFDSVADNYDLMNDLMSAGLHRLWKRFALAQTGLRPGQHALHVQDYGRQVRPALTLATVMCFTCPPKSS